MNGVQMIFQTEYYKEDKVRELERIMQIAGKISNCLSREEMELITDWLKCGGYEVYCSLDYQLNPTNYSRFLSSNITLT